MRLQSDRYDFWLTRSWTKGRGRERTLSSWQDEGEAGISHRKDVVGSWGWVLGERGWQGSWGLWLSGTREGKNFFRYSMTICLCSCEVRR